MPTQLLKELCSSICMKMGLKDGFKRKKMVIKEMNRKKRLPWCREKRRWSVHNNWKRIIFSDKSKVMIGHDERVYVWRKAGEGWRPNLSTTKPRPKFEVMIWGCISWFGPGTITAVDGNINAIKHQDILEDHLWSVVAQHFPQGGYIFQDHNAPVHRARSTVTCIQNPKLHPVTYLAC